MSGLQLLAISIFWIIAALGIVMVVMLLFKPGAVYPNFKVITGLDFEALIKAKTVQEPAVKKIIELDRQHSLGQQWDDVFSGGFRVSRSALVGLVCFVVLARHVQLALCHLST